MPYFPLFYHATDAFVDNFLSPTASQLLAENTGFSNLSVLHLDDVTSVFILQSLSAFPNLKALSLRDNYNPYGFGQGKCV